MIFINTKKGKIFHSHFQAKNSRSLWDAVQFIDFWGSKSEIENLETELY